MDDENKLAIQAIKDKYDEVVAKYKNIEGEVKKVNDVDLVKESEFMKKIVKHHAKIDQKLVVKNRYIKV